MAMQRRQKTALILMMLGLLAAPAGIASAQAGAAGEPQASAAQAPAPQEQPDQFVPVKTLPQQEQLPAAGLLLTAYGFVWAVLLVYVWTIWRRLMKVEREMQILAARIGEKRSEASWARKSSPPARWEPATSSTSQPSCFSGS
jgi:CcmD family protein